MACDRRGGKNGKTNRVGVGPRVVRAIVLGCHVTNRKNVVPSQQKRKKKDKQQIISSS